MAQATFSFAFPSKQNGTNSLHCEDLLYLTHTQYFRFILLKSGQFREKRRKCHITCSKLDDAEVFRTIHQFQNNEKKFFSNIRKTLSNTKYLVLASLSWRQNYCLHRHLSEANHPPAARGITHLPRVLSSPRPWSSSLGPVMTKGPLSRPSQSSGWSSLPRNYRRGKMCPL